MLQKIGAAVNTRCMLASAKGLHVLRALPEEAIRQWAQEQHPHIRSAPAANPGSAHVQTYLLALPRSGCPLRDT